MNVSERKWEREIDEVGVERSVEGMVRRWRMVFWGRGDVEERKGVGGGSGGGSSFVHVRFYVPADVQLLMYDSLAHSEAHNFRLISPREIRTMILLSTCSRAIPKTARNRGRWRGRKEE